MSTTETSPVRLKSDVIGLMGAATLGMVFLSPAMTLYGLFGPIFLACGNAAPLSMLLGLLATLPTAFSYSVLSRDYPSSGSTADWAARATGARMGAWAGWLVLLYYLTNFIIQIVAVGLFFNELLLAISIRLPSGLGFTLGVLLGCSWPAWMVYRGLSLSAKGALAFLLVEILTVTLLLCVTVVLVAPKHGTPVTLQGFFIPAAMHNSSGMFSALVFAMLGFCGFTFIVVACVGAYDAYVWWCTTSTFFAMLTFLFGNLACILLNLGRIRSSLSGALMFLVVPSLGIIADLYITVESFFIELWAQPWATGKSVVVFDLVCAAAALVTVSFFNRTLPRKLNVEVQPARLDDLQPQSPV